MKFEIGDKVLLGCGTIGVVDELDWNKEYPILVKSNFDHKYYSFTTEGIWDIDNPVQIHNIVRIL